MGNDSQKSFDTTGIECANEATTLLLSLYFFYSFSPPD